jgi:hypothetical protein
VFQTAFMMYMFVGNQLSLFSIFFLLTMGTGPIRNLLNTGQGAWRRLTVPAAPPPPPASAPRASVRAPAPDGPLMLPPLHHPRFALQPSSSSRCPACRC